MQVIIYGDMAWKLWALRVQWPGPQLMQMRGGQQKKVMVKEVKIQMHLKDGLKIGLGQVILQLIKGLYKMD